MHFFGISPEETTDMKQYLTINEFAKLRNVNANSIRYYEKLKILTPVRVDSKTGYRYYLPEQLVLLDIILLCIQFDIPLKNLKGYIDENGGLDGKRIFEDGKQIMQKKISEMQAGLNLAEFNLNMLEQNQKYSDKKGIYTRAIGERFLFVEPFQGQWDNLLQKEKTVIELFRTAQEEHMMPVFPAGILVNSSEEASPFSFFLQVLRPREKDPRILHLPEGTYACLQTDLTPETDISQVLEAHFPSSGTNTAVISNMLMNKVYFNSRHSEIQVYLPDPPS